MEKPGSQPFAAGCGPAKAWHAAACPAPRSTILHVLLPPATVATADVKVVAPGKPAIEGIEVGALAQVPHAHM